MLSSHDFKIWQNGIKCNEFLRELVRRGSSEEKGVLKGDKEGGN